MSGEHSHQELATKEELAAVATASAADVAALSVEVAVLANRVAALENGVEPPPVEPPVEPPPSTDKYLWSTLYEDDPWWDNHGVIGVAYQQSHDLATDVVADPFGEFNHVVKVDCLPNAVLDTTGTTYGFTDRCSFEQMGLCGDDRDGVREYYCAMYVAVPANWGEAEDDVRWRTQSGSCKMPNTFSSYDPARGSGSVPYSNNFAALAWAANLGCILKGPPSLTDYDRDHNRPSTFFSVAQAGRQTRQPVANGTKVSMIQFYWHLNPNPNDLVTGAGGASKPWVYVERGKWHKVETYVRTNTLGQANGEYKAWWNGDLAMWINDLKLGPNWARGMNLWHNQYFHGGPSGLDTKQTMFLGPAAFDNERLLTF